MMSLILPGHALAASCCTGLRLAVTVALCEAKEILLYHDVWPLAKEDLERISGSSLQAGYLNQFRVLETEDLRQGT